MQLSVSEALKKGVEAHKAGQLQEAEKAYTYILKAQPKHPDANHNMGILAVGVGKPEASLPFFNTATVAKPQVVQFWLSYVDVLIVLGRIIEAQGVFDQAILKGVKGEEFDKLKRHLISLSDPVAVAGTNILDTIKLDKAIRLADKATKNGRKEEAKKIYQNVIERFPKHKKALAALNGMNSGVLAAGPILSTQQQQLVIDLFAKGQFKQALSSACQLLRSFPTSSLLHNIVGASNAGLMQFEAAIASYEKALDIDPNAPETHYNMAASLNDNGSVELAQASYKQALKLKPNYPDATKNLGNILYDNKDYQAALECFDKLNDKYSVSRALECTYCMEQYDEFNQRISSIAKNNPSNIRVAALSAFAAQQLKQPDAYPFCKKPNELVAFSNLKYHMADYEAFIDALLNEMNEKETSWEPKNHATKSGFHTAGNLFTKPSPALQVLEGVVHKELGLFYEQFKGLDNGLIQNWPIKSDVKSWYVRMLKNGHQSAHIHSAGCVSGVVYLKTVDAPTDNEGAIEFGLHGYGYPVKDADYPKRVYQPNKGDIVLFPSSLFHQTVPVLKNVERCVIAFDLRK